MVKKGRLDNVEKYAIQGMAGQDMSIEEMANKLDRSERVITNYINGELTELLGTIDRVRNQKAKSETKKRKRYAELEKNEIHRIREDIEDETNQAPQRSIDPRIEKEVYHQLVQSGLGERDAERLVKTVVKICEQKGIHIPNAKTLFTNCIRRMNAGHFITKKTTGRGESGVAVMSSAASQRLDEARKRNTKPISRSARGNMYNPSTGEIL